jgi:hypothetical protein
LRGEILLKPDPANTAPAEDALLTAIGVAPNRRRGVSSGARRSRWRSHSTGRAADAHGFLASALNRFSPTPEFPEIAEAQMLLAAEFERIPDARCTVCKRMASNGSKVPMNWVVSGRAVFLRALIKWAR